MTISEIKGLTRFLSEEEVEEIKKQIKDKENILKGGNLEEEEMIQVLNTLFSVLVIEKALESEIEDIEDLRDELESELLECYDVYDSYMSKYKKEDKKKKKKWLLHFFGLSEMIKNKKKNINDSNVTISKLQNELNELKKQRSNENLSDVVSKKGPLYDKFCDCPHEHEHPRRREPRFIREKIDERRRKEDNGRTQINNPVKGQTITITVEKQQTIQQQKNNQPKINQQNKRTRLSSYSRQLPRSKQR